jgi:hypothetical protein
MAVKYSISQSITGRSFPRQNGPQDKEAVYGGGKTETGPGAFGIVLKSYKADRRKEKQQNKTAPYQEDARRGGNERRYDSKPLLPGRRGKHEQCRS